MLRTSPTTKQTGGSRFRLTVASTWQPGGGRRGGETNGSQERGARYRGLAVSENYWLQWVGTLAVQACQWLQRRAAFQGGRSAGFAGP